MVKKFGKLGVFDSIREAFKKWAANFIIVMPFVFNFLITIAIGGAAIIGAIAVFFGVYATSLTLTTLQQMTETEMVTALANALTPGAMAFVGLAIFLLILIFTIIQSFFESGAIGMSMDLGNGRKTSLKTMWKTGKKFWLRSSLLKIIFGFLILIFSLIFFIPFVLTENVFWIILLFIMIIPAIFFLIMFSFAQYLLIINDLDVFKSIKASWKFVGRRYWRVWGLVLMIGLISLVAGFIPYVSYVLAILLTAPIQALSYVIYALNNS
ncbi:hypothetical protein J4465_02690 [Candidatus Pacearchaeota archaeon]|nr:hypothetical protein [Candidatus Pacearchaeota archaeon]